MKEGGIGIMDKPRSYDEGRGLRMRAGVHRRRAGHIGGGQCMSVGRGTQRWGWHAWEEGGVHGRKAAHMGGGQHAWEEVAQVGHIGGGRLHH